MGELITSAEKDSPENICTVWEVEIVDGLLKVLGEKD